MKKTRGRTDVVTDILASKDVNNEQQGQIFQNSNPDEILKSLKREMAVYESTGRRTVKWEQIHNALLIMVASLVETERAFSACGMFVTKMLMRLSYYSINILCFFVRPLSVTKK